MLLIVAVTADEEKLDALVSRYDRAKNDMERERLVGEIYDVVGPKVRAMIAHVGRGRLQDDQVDAFAMEALSRGLRESGHTQFLRTSADWDALIARCRKGIAPAAGLLWQSLPSQLQQELFTRRTYVPQNLIDRFVRTLNLLIRDRRFVGEIAMTATLDSEGRKLMSKGVEKLPATQVSRLGALAIASAFPDEIRAVPETRHSLLGLISKSIIPQMKEDLWRETGSQFSEHLAEVWSALKPHVTQLAEMQRSGTLPQELEGKSQSQQVFELYRRGLEQFRPAIQWYERQVARLQPSNSFRISTAEALRDAKALLRQHGVPEREWPNVPTRALKPYSQQTIARVLEMAGRRDQTVYTAAPSMGASPMTVQDDPVWGNLKGIDDPARVYRFLVEKLFPTGSAEHRVGLFVADHPSYSPQEVATFVASLPEDIRDDIESIGWGALVREIDEKALSQIRQPGALAEIAHSTGQAPQQVQASLSVIRRDVFLRTSELILGKQFRKAG